MMCMCLQVECRAEESFFFGGRHSAEVYRCLFLSSSRLVKMIEASFSLKERTREKRMELGQILIRFP